MSQSAPDDPPPTEQQVVRWLRALADAVERDPALAARVAASATEPPAGPIELPAEVEEVPARAEPLPPVATIPPATEAPAESDLITPTLRHTRRGSRYGTPSVAGRAAALGTGIPDPFALFAAEGEEGLRQALATLRVGTLRAIVRAHALDPAGKLSTSTTEKRLITAIIAAVKRQSPLTQGPPPAPRKRATKARPAKHS
jgi:hypothetical protein